MGSYQVRMSLSGHPLLAIYQPTILEKNDAYTCLYSPRYYGSHPNLYQNRHGKARRLAENSRENIAKTVAANANEIYFTSGGSQIRQLGIKGSLQAHGTQKAKTHYHFTFEHHAILHILRLSLEKEALRCCLDVAENLVCSPKMLKTLSEDTAMYLIYVCKQ